MAFIIGTYLSIPQAIVHYLKDTSTKSTLPKDSLSVTTGQTNYPNI